MKKFGSKCTAMSGPGPGAGSPLMLLCSLPQQLIHEGAKEMVQVRNRQVFSTQSHGPKWPQHILTKCVIRAFLTFYYSK